MNKTPQQLHQVRQKMWLASMSNHLKFIDSKTGLFKSEYTEERNCPVCQNNDTQHLFYKEGGCYVKCVQCSMVYLNPVFKDTALIEYYQNNHAIQSEIVENDDDGFYKKLYSQGIEQTIKASPDSHSILDIGCSSGAFLNIAAQYKLRTCGIELNKQEAALAKTKGHRIFQQPLEQFPLEESFDIITLWDVFEHIKDGYAYLNLLKKYLSPRGVIFLQIPSADSLAAKILQDQCNMFDGLEHVNLYGVSSLNKLARRCGLQVISQRTVISEIGVIQNYLNYEHPYLGQISNTHLIQWNIDEDDIHHSLLGYKLQIVLKGVKS